MPTQRFKAYSEPARVTDCDAVQNIINAYRFPIDVEVYIVPGTNKLRVDGNGNFLEAYTTGDDEPEEAGLAVAHTPALDQFFTEITEFIEPGDELVVQLVGIGATDQPLVAVEWCISPTGVTETAFTHGESTSWTDLPQTNSTGR